MTYRTRSRTCRPYAKIGMAAVVCMLGALAVSRSDAQHADEPPPQGERRAESTVTRVIPVQYRDAVELAVILRQHVGPCAVITADPHTNALIITSSPSCLQGQLERKRSRGEARPPSERQLE